MVTNRNRKEKVIIYTSTKAIPKDLTGVDKNNSNKLFKVVRLNFFYYRIFPLVKGALFY